MLNSKARLAVVVPLLAGVLLGGVFVRVAAAAQAFDLEISGPGLQRPVVVTWDSMAEAVQAAAQDAGSQSTGFFHDGSHPKVLRGPAYSLKVAKFIPSDPPRRIGSAEWTYYPQLNLIRTDDPRQEWLEPVPALQSVLERAITPPDTRRPGLWLVVVLMASIVAVSVLTLRLWRTRHGWRTNIHGQVQTEHSKHDSA